MRLFSKLPVLVLLAASALSARPARADLYMTAIDTGGDGAKQGEAQITLGTGTVTIALSSLVNDPTGAGQEVSGIIVNFVSNVGASSFISDPTASAVNINANNTFTLTPNTDLLTGQYTWGEATSGKALTVEAAGNASQGGQPWGLIIGPSSNGTYVPGANSLYDNANPSITGHGPVAGPVTFSLNVAGITASSTISSVSILFGTGPDQSLPTTLQHQQIVAPEPSTIALAISALPIGLVVWSRRRRKARMA